MQLIRGIQKLQKKHQGAAISIGKFDALHQGHQLLFQNIKQYSKQYKCPSLIILFEPYPNDYFQKKINPRVTTLRDKLTYLRKQSMDYVLCLPFNKQLANMSAEAFIEQIIIKHLKVNKIWIGDDFYFGKDRQGNYQMLQAYSRQHSFLLEQIKPYFYGNQKISSSLIRQQLNAGEFNQAKKFTGENFNIRGKVILGRQLGRELGYPTANISLTKATLKAKANLLPRGVYAVKVKLLNDTKKLEGVANLGYKPTLTAQQFCLETHLFNFSEDIYQQFIQVEFVEFIRPEQKFASLDLLKQQIQRDNQKAQAILKRLT